MGVDAGRAEGVKARKDHDGLLEDVVSFRTKRTHKNLFELFVLFPQSFREWDLLERHTQTENVHIQHHHPQPLTVCQLFFKREKKGG